MKLIDLARSLPGYRIKISAICDVTREVTQEVTRDGDEICDVSSVRRWSPTLTDAQIWAYQDRGVVKMVQDVDQRKVYCIVTEGSGDDVQ